MIDICKKKGKTFRERRELRKDKVKLIMFKSFSINTILFRIKKKKIIYKY